MKRTLRFLTGAIVGAIAGSLTVLLLTPESGENTRLAISEKLQYLRDQMREAAKERRIELEAEIQKYKETG